MFGGADASVEVSVPMLLFAALVLCPAPSIVARAGATFGAGLGGTGEGAMPGPMIVALARGRVLGESVAARMFGEAGSIGEAVGCGRVLGMFALAAGLLGEPVA